MLNLLAPNNGNQTFFHNVLIIVITTFIFFFDTSDECIIFTPSQYNYGQFGYNLESLNSQQNPVLQKKYSVHSVRTMWLACELAYSQLNVFASKKWTEFDTLVFNLI